MPKIAALIPLRGGSKSIPHKNIKEIAGKPLAYWSLKAASDSKYIEDVYVSTDDGKIKEVVESLNLGVKVIDRPPHLATDKATTDSVMVHFMNNIDFDILFTIQATSPVVTGDDYDKGYQKFTKEKADSMVSGVITNRFIWRIDGTPLNYDPLYRPMRQDFTKDNTILTENGAFYITNRKILEKHECRLGGKISIYPMKNEVYREIDDPEDWIIVEKILLEKYGPH